MIVLINRAQQIFSLRVEAPDILFDGTILDGELVQINDGSFCFIAYDCIIANGVQCSEYNYLIRLTVADFVVSTMDLLQRTST